MKNHFLWRWCVSLLLSSPVFGYDVNLNNGHPITWDAGTVTIKLLLPTTPVLSDGSTYVSSVQTALQAWNAQISTVQFANQTGLAVSPANNSTNEIAFDSTVYGTAFDADVLAITVFYYSSSARSDGTYRRTQADVIFNKAYTWDSYRGSLRSSEDIQRVALHELGHVLGLDHPDEASPPQSVTAQMNSHVSNLDTLTADDIAGAQSLYGAPNSAAGIGSQPENQSVYTTQTAQFTVVATGKPAPSVKWQRKPNGGNTWSDLSNSGNYSGSTTATLSVAGVVLSMNGDQFRCVATNTLGSATSNAALLSVTASTVPAITSQPLSQTVQEGNSVTFTSAATGVPSPTFQWRKGGVDIAGANGTSYTIPVVLAADAGSYTMVASNLAGSTPSNGAVLTVTAPPVISILSPARQNLSPGQSLNLSVTATGTGTITYEWIHNGRTVVGATGPSLVVASVGIQDGGWYVVRSTDVNGTRRSSPLFVFVSSATRTRVRAWGTGDYGLTTVPAESNDAIAVDAGLSHALALKKDGTVVSWGAVDQPQAQVPTGLNGVVAIAAGWSSSFALKSDGTVVAWGIQDSDNVVGGVPPGLKDVVAIAVGLSHALALKSDGTVTAWGKNGQGESTVPSGLTGVVAVAAGDSISLALKSDGTVVSWGVNAAPIPSGLNGVVAMTAGWAHVLVLKNNGSLVSWGNDNYGLTEPPVSSSGYKAIAAGSNFSFAVTNTGKVVAWGFPSENSLMPPADLTGVLSVGAGIYYVGLAVVDASLDTVPVVTAPPVNKTATEGQAVTFSVTANAGTASISYQWRHNGGSIAGANSASLILSNLRVEDAGTYDVVVTSYLGSVTSASATLSVKALPVISNLSQARQVLSPGQALTLEVSATGTGTLSYQWVRNGLPVTGGTSSQYKRPTATLADSGWYVVLVTDSNGTRRSAPVFVTVAPTASMIRAWGYDGAGVLAVPSGLTGVVAVAASNNTFGLALKRDGTVVAWGDNNSGATTVPAGLTGVVSVAAGYYHSLALKSDGTVVAWGYNGSGQAAVPVGLNNVVAIAAGELFSLALKSDGTMVAWGADDDGLQSIPSAATGAIAISVRGWHAMALKPNGTVIAWGDNSAGQSTVPTGLAGVIAISSGYVHSLALKSNGTVVAWGYNDEGETTVPTGLSGVMAIAGGQRQSLALKSDGTIVGWGYNLWGQATAPSGLTNVWAISTGDVFSLALYDAVNDAPPSISTPASNYQIQEDQPLSLSVTATSTSVMTYQWRKDGVAISGATQSTFTIPQLALGDAGTYDVLVGNYLGTTVGTIAVLTIVPVPKITDLSPVRQVVQPGQALSLSVTATGTGAITYQWKRNGRVIAGATAAAYTVPHAAVTDGGYYTVDLTDSLGIRHGPAIFVTVASPNGGVVAWGDLTKGSVNPLPSSVNNVIAVAAGGFSSVALRSDGTVVPFTAYTMNSTLEVFTPPSYYSSINIPTNLGNVAAVAAGAKHSLALAADGRVFAWGDNTFGQCVVPSSLKNVVMMTAGVYHSVALKLDGTVVCWGDNTWGQCTVPTNLSDVVSVAAGTNYSLALKADGTVIAWGSGVGFPTVPTGLSNVKSIAGGSSFCVAQKTDGTVISWGNQSTDSVPANLGSVVALSSGFVSTLALKSDGTLVGWNDNTFDASNSPVTIPAGLVDVSSMAVGTFYWLAVSNAAPSFTVQPISKNLPPGGSTRLVAAATGVPTPTYQWRKNGVNINGATSASYAIASVSAGDAGSYQVIASNSVGTTASDVAILTVTSSSNVVNGRTGDFNGDGKSDLLWQNTGTGQRSIWLMNGTTLTAGVSLGLSPTQWSIAAVADFNADGKPDLLWQNTLTGERTFWLMNGSTFVSSADLGTYSTDLMIAGAGDFNGDGKPDLVWQNTSTGERSIWLMNETTLDYIDDLGTFPPEWSIAGTGEFNGDGKCDLIWQNTVTGERAMWLMNGTTVTAGVALGVYPQLQISGTGDYNGDGKSDILWTNVSTGERIIWLMNGTTKASEVSLGVVSLDWVLNRPVFRRALADFNNDGKSDLVWQNSVTGDRAIWIMNGIEARTGLSLGNYPVDQWIAAVGDFNNDGKADLVWENRTTGARSIALMNGTTVLSTVALGTYDTAWKINTTGDFNADGKPDLVWTNTTTGARAIWLMDGTAFTAGIDLGTVAGAQQVAGTGDFDGDGKTDILWQNTTTGTRTIWLMNGTTHTSTVTLGTYAPEWSIVGTGDYNADGKPDLLWQNINTGERAIWLMNGTTFLSSSAIGTYDTKWSIKN